MYACIGNEDSKSFLFPLRLKEIVLPTTFKLPLNPHLKVGCCLYISCMYA